MKTWLITGCSSGFGRSLAEAVLKKGWNAVVTARKPEALEDFRGKYPETSFVLPLDVTDMRSIRMAVSQAIDHFGKIDVVVNNAGYCLRGAVEECTIEEIKRQFDTNFFGAVNVIKEVLPHMRKEKNGAIINFSSIAALATSEGSAYYGASKAALEGMSDGLRKEIGILGIKVMVVEPGPFKTDFFNRSLDVNDINIEDYKDTARKRKARTENLEELSGWAWGDTDKAAEVIISAIGSNDHPFHLLLGTSAIRIAENSLAARKAEIDQWRELSSGTDC
jgi:NAD(P)-dependent dehydrogenase (short-subunit alcohol dehydrogenase family)